MIRVEILLDDTDRTPASVTQVMGGMLSKLGDVKEIHIFAEEDD